MAKILPLWKYTKSGLRDTMIANFKPVMGIDITLEKKDGKIEARRTKDNSYITTSDSLFTIGDAIAKVFIEDMGLKDG